MCPLEQFVMFSPLQKSFIYFFNENVTSNCLGVPSFAQPPLFTSLVISQNYICQLKYLSSRSQVRAGWSVRSDRCNICSDVGAARNCHSEAGAEPDSETL